MSSAVASAEVQRRELLETLTEAAQQHQQGNGTVNGELFGRLLDNLQAFLEASDAFAEGSHGPDRVGSSAEAAVSEVEGQLREAVARCDLQARALTHMRDKCERFQREVLQLRGQLGAAGGGSGGCGGGGSSTAAAPAAPAVAAAGEGSGAGPSRRVSQTQPQPQQVDALRAGLSELQRANEQLGQEAVQLAALAEQREAGLVAQLQRAKTDAAAAASRAGAAQAAADTAGMLLRQRRAEATGGGGSGVASLLEEVEALQSSNQSLRVQLASVEEAKRTVARSAAAEAEALAAANRQLHAQVDLLREQARGASEASAAEISGWQSAAQQAAAMAESAQAAAVSEGRARAAAEASAASSAAETHTLRGAADGRERLRAHLTRLEDALLRPLAEWYSQHHPESERPRSRDFAALKDKAERLLWGVPPDSIDGSDDVQLARQASTASSALEKLLQRAVAVEAMEARCTHLQRLLADAEEREAVAVRRLEKREEWWAARAIEAAREAEAALQHARAGADEDVRMAREALQSEREAMCASAYHDGVAKGRRHGEEELRQLRRASAEAGADARVHAERVEALQAELSSSRASVAALRRDAERESASSELALVREAALREAAVKEARREGDARVARAMAEAEDVAAEAVASACARADRAMAEASDEAASLRKRASSSEQSVAELAQSLTEAEEQLSCARADARAHMEAGAELRRQLDSTADLAQRLQEAEEQLTRVRADARAHEETGGELRRRLDSTAVLLEERTESAMADAARWLDAATVAEAAQGSLSDELSGMQVAASQLADKTEELEAETRSLRSALASAQRALSEQVAESAAFRAQAVDATRAATAAAGALEVHADACAALQRQVDALRASHAEEMARLEADAAAWLRRAQETYQAGMRAAGEKLGQLRQRQHLIASKIESDAERHERARGSSAAAASAAGGSSRRPELSSASALLDGLEAWQPDVTPNRQRLDKQRLDRQHLDQQRVDAVGWGRQQQEAAAAAGGRQQQRLDQQRIDRQHLGQQRVDAVGWGGAAAGSGSSSRGAAAAAAWRGAPRGGQPSMGRAPPGIPA
ncbi:hypothetical protein FOA52_007418 [Chlamydomonas sp. UWO 241]|nr:hypothetical protein FOA52_007418 [Chlamydomonas sp. UWO 241]